MLLLQAEVINRIRSGYRPLQPVARGSAKPLPDFLISLPPLQIATWLVKPRGMTVCARGRPCL